MGALLTGGDAFRFMDEAIYADAAERLRTGAGLGPDYLGVPGYPAFLAVVYAAVLAAWFAIGVRLPRWGFYVLFAIVVTLSVQLVGLYLVFATLIVPPLATRNFGQRRLAIAWAVGVAGYAVGLTVSTITDLPSGPVVVWALVAIALLVDLAARASATVRRAEHLRRGL